MRHITIRVAVVIIMNIVIGCDDRLRSEDVTFADPALQECFDDQLRTDFGRPYADEIEIIRCNFSEIVSLEGIEVLSGLKQIELRYSPRLAVIEPVLSLPALNWLDLSDCGLGSDSTTVLSMLSTPVRLDISGNDLGDVSPYAQTTSLTGLVAEASNITKGIADLITLTNATVLSFDGNPASPCTDLEFLRVNTPESVMVLPLAADVEPGNDCAP